jgi:hypothetical protein
MMGNLPCDYMTLFETIDMAKVMIITQVKDLLVSYNLLNKLITYVKDKDGNMSTLALIYLFIDRCVLFTIASPWLEGHVLVM